MKRTRNSYFQENGMNVGQPMPYQATSFNSFYAGGMPNFNQTSDDLESRLAKMERQINRLDHRLSKLEANPNAIIDDYDTNTTNMYML